VIAVPKSELDKREAAYQRKKVAERKRKPLEQRIAGLDAKSGVVYYTTFGVYYMLGIFL
jgi:hypothetical protein